jgi:hypothetical protein
MTWRVARSVALSQVGARRPPRGSPVMIATSDPLDEIRRWCAVEVEILDRALAVVRDAFILVDELLADEQARGAAPVFALRLPDD